MMCSCKENKTAGTRYFYVNLSLQHAWMNQKPTRANIKLHYWPHPKGRQIVLTIVSIPLVSQGCWCSWGKVGGHVGWTWTDCLLNTNYQLLKPPSRTWSFETGNNYWSFRFYLFSNFSSYKFLIEVRGRDLCFSVLNNELINFGFS